MSIREQILQSIVTRLAGTSGVGDRIFRSRVQALSRQESPALVVTPASEENNTLPGGVSDRYLTVRIDVVARSETPDQEADPVLASAHAKIMADTRLGGLSVNIEEVGTEWDLEDADSGAALIAVQYRIQYRTRMKDLSSQ
ncbi:DUF3168 domain-containing protein [Herbaspirillum sp. ST 5-3]|uniref:DUF3168 domain-containing protein n=1 Tax=Oxalobacteraceae TaxID=75682 RepID=UPI0010A3D42B|nr:DUF3168 domain-containing protein [Herbaspirillum sp. ST 5-3]